MFWIPFESLGRKALLRLIQGVAIKITPASQSALEDPSERAERDSILHSASSIVPLVGLVIVILVGKAK
jgi:hypothetical protein